MEYANITTNISPHAGRTAVELTRKFDENIKYIILGDRVGTLSETLNYNFSTTVLVTERN